MLFSAVAEKMLVGLYALQKLKPLLLLLLAKEVRSTSSTDTASFVKWGVLTHANTLSYVCKYKCVHMLFKFRYTYMYIYVCVCINKYKWVPFIQTFHHPSYVGTVPLNEIDSTLFSTLTV